jgi:hypothetical protein
VTEYPVLALALALYIFTTSDKPRQESVERRTVRHAQREPARERHHVLHVEAFVLKRGMMAVTLRNGDASAIKVSAATERDHSTV